MSNTPSNAEAWDLWLESITGGHHPASLAKFARAVLAKWGTPKPVVREPLTDAQIKELIEDGVFLGNCKEIVRAIERAHGITQKGVSNADT